MKIDTTNFKSFSSIIDSFKDDSDLKTRSIFFDFTDSMAYLVNRNFAGRIKFTFEGIPVPNFYVDITKFLTLCSMYPQIDVNEDFKFNCGEDSFKLMTFAESFDSIDFSTDGFDLYTLSSDLSAMFKTAFNFMGKNDFERNHAGVAFTGNKVVASDGIKFFEGKHDMNLPFLKIGKELCSIIKEGDPLGVNLYYKEDKSTVIVSIANGDLVVVSPTVESLSIPNLNDPEFINKYNHKDSFSLNRKSFFETLGFFESFVRDIRNQPLYLTLESETSLAIEARGDETGKKYLPLVSCSSGIVGETFIIMRDVMKTCVNSFVEEELIIKYSADSNVFSLLGKDNDKKLILVVKMRD